MKPNIVNIIYFSLGYLALSAGAQVYSLADSNLGNGHNWLYNASLSILVVVLSIAAILGLIKRQPWSRWASIWGLAVQGAGSIILAVYFLVEAPEIGRALLIATLPIGLALLFLAYKVYASAPLKEYVGRA